MNVLISTSSFAQHSREPLELLEGFGAIYRVNASGRKLSEDEIASLLHDIDGLVAGTEPLTRQVLRCAPRLRAISRCGTGLDNVDLHAAAEFGIKVCNTPEAHVDAVAELALGTILSTLRHLAEADRAVRSGEWKKPMGRLLRAKMVGFVGMGRVGRRLVQLLAPFEVFIQAADPCVDPELERSYTVRYTALDELLESADIVSLHLPYSAETHHLVDQRRIRRMKPGAILINCARGGLVDERALYEALRAGHLGGAHLDTFEREPYEGPLSTLSNVSLSPHIGSYAMEGRIRMETEAVVNLIDCLSNGRQR